MINLEHFRPFKFEYPKTTPWFGVNIFFFPIKETHEEKVLLNTTHIDLETEHTNWKMTKIVLETNTVLWKIEQLKWKHNIISIELFSWN